MPKRTTPPLSYGEYVLPHAWSRNASRARQVLMQVVNRVFPRFLEELRDRVYPRYAEIAARDEKVIRPRRNMWPRPPTPEHGEVWGLLARWAHSFHAETDWLLQEALQTMRLWYHHRKLRDLLEWFSVSAIREISGLEFPDGSPIVQRFELSFRPWNPEIETWAQFSAEVQRSFEMELRAYEAGTRKDLKDFGLVPARTRYSLRNLEWFALYQFGGMSYKEIADQENGKFDESAVRKGVKTAAHLVGWDNLRKSSQSNRKVR